MSWVYQRLVIWGPDAIYDMVGSSPELTGAMKAAAGSVLYVVGKTVSFRSPSVPHLRFNWADAAFEFNFK